MKQTLILLSFLLVAVSLCAAQPADHGDKFKIGAKTVTVPTPDGFVNGYPGIAQIKANVAAFEDPKGRTLSMYVTRPIAQKLLRGEPVERLGFFAKIAVLKEMDNIDVTPEMLTDLAVRTERDFEPMTDVELPKAVAAGRKSLAKFQGKSVEVGLSRPINLGSIDRRPDVFSLLTMTTIEQPDQHTVMLGVMGHVVVKGRLLYINIYRESTDDRDAEMLRDFARKWADEILAANR